MFYKTTRLYFHPWEDKDAAELFELAKNPNVGPRAGWPPHTSVEDSLGIIHEVLAEPENYAIRRIEDDVLVGCIGLMFGNRAKTEAEKKTNLEIGYWLGEEFWGKGYMPEAVTEAIRYAFEDLNMEKVWCAYFDGNIQSKSVQEKVGFAYEFTLDKVKTMCGEDDIRVEKVNLLTRDMYFAKRCLVDEGKTCVLQKGDKQETSEFRGVKPLLNWLESGEDYEGFVAADKVVGKAAAYLYVLLKVSRVHANIISKPAYDTLVKYGIKVSYDTMVDAIRNRTNTGFCPMESAVIEVDDPHDALEVIKNTLMQL